MSAGKKMSILLLGDIFSILFGFSCENAPKKMLVITKLKLENNQAGKIIKLTCIKSTRDNRRQKQNKKFQIINSNIDHLKKKRKRGKKKEKVICSLLD